MFKKLIKASINTSFYLLVIIFCSILSFRGVTQNLDLIIYDSLLNKFPKMERYFRTIYETAYGAALMRFKYINTYSKEEIFFRFKEKFPEFVQRVPQYVLASFLGLTPEYLSEIKKKQFS